jgi:hypothetical protein
MGADEHGLKTKNGLKEQKRLKEDPLRGFASVVSVVAGFAVFHVEHLGTGGEEEDAGLGVGDGDGWGGGEFGR